VARSLIAFTDKEPKDWMVPSRWGTVCIITTVLTPDATANTPRRLTSAKTLTLPSKVAAAAS
jgi:hypothetical protein